MNRRNFFTHAIKAIAVVALYPLDKAFELTLKPSKKFTARLGEWNNYYSEGDPELMEAIENWKPYPVHHTADIYFDRELIPNLKSDPLAKAFEALTSRETIPMNMGMKREFFRYDR